MARDHPKKASSSSKDESNKDESLSTRRSEIVLLSLFDKCAIGITHFIRFVGKIKAEAAAELHASSDSPEKLKERPGIEKNIR
jgi:hypothetical protein